MKKIFAMIFMVLIILNNVSFVYAAEYQLTEEEKEALDHAYAWDIATLEERKNLYADESVRRLRYREALSALRSDGFIVTYWGETVSREEVLRIAQCVVAECGYGTYYGKRAVAECVCNRMQSPYWPSSVYELIDGGKQFQYAPVREDSFLTSGIWNECYLATIDALTTEPIYHRDMIFFRSGYYFDSHVGMGYVCPYVNEDGNFFSTQNMSMYE